ncbi:hypothetical protein NA644_14100 [Pseudomonas stutzeri]|jgi:hypothetical protein|uniref:Uncharacterized protein n=1 Tax=Stutzerimonas stutzeri TaxID=316 RepID=A0A2N8T0S9_STUST|nr:hypothetical protein [Stutzerimonas stutzeri]EQM77570.1 hypothetical protein L686_15805 [Stutzerimonas stutzeri MF28]MCI0916157.1 hypothetical protein [Stutzerimonas stutzeri]MCQ4250442.1 hypothetical protein [Stutzerimonas stutzeri]PNG08348.1 hypothetical protein CXL00_04730 [Stutzerimonas stutzeri]
MMSKILLMSAGLMCISGLALADTDHDLSAPSTTGTEAMEQPSSQIDDAGPDRRDSDEAVDDDDSSGLGTMGAGARGTTGGMGATTGTDTLEDRDAETEQ